MLAFGHMLPHALCVFESEKIDRYNQCYKNNFCPHVTFTFCRRTHLFMFTLLGYMTMFMIENIFFNSHAILHSVMDDNGHNHGHNHGSAISCTIDHGHSSQADVHGHDHAHAHTDFAVTGTDLSTTKKTVLSANSAIALLLAMAVHR